MIEKLIAKYVYDKDLNYLYDKKLYDALYVLNEVNKLKYFIISFILGFFIENQIISILFFISVIAAYITQKEKDLDFSMISEFKSTEKWYLIFFLSYGIGVWSNYFGAALTGVDLFAYLKIIAVILFTNGIHRFLKGKLIRNYISLIVSIVITALYLPNLGYILLTITSWYVFEKFNSLKINILYIILTIIFMSIGNSTTLLFFGSLGIYLSIKNLRKINYAITFR